MTVAVAKDVIESVRPPRAALYDGEYGSVAGRPSWSEQQRRVLDEALRLIEPMDQAGIRRLNVDMESAVEKERGERTRAGAERRAVDGPHALMRP